MIQRLSQDKATPCRYGAPTVLVVAFDKKNVLTYPGGKRDSGIEDASIEVMFFFIFSSLC
jgi:hypothetical protein